MAAVIGLRFLQLLLVCLAHAIIVDVPLWLYGLAGNGYVAWRLSKRPGLVAYRQTQYFNRRCLEFTSLSLWILCNEEDGIDGRRGIPTDPLQQWWVDENPGATQQQLIWRWSGLRNPYDNLRMVPVLSPSWRPARIGWRQFGNIELHYADPPQWPLGSVAVPTGQFGGWIGWHGLCVGLFLQWPSGRALRLGYDIRPGDERGPSMIGTRMPRVHTVWEAPGWL